MPCHRSRRRARATGRGCGAWHQRLIEGRWRIVETELWDQEALDLVVPAYMRFDRNGLGEMESIRSESIEGLSILTAVFKENTDPFRARQTLAEKLAETAGTLPLGVKSPRMTPLTSSTMDLLKIGLISDQLTPMELRTFADWTDVRPGFLEIAAYGVALIRLEQPRHEIGKAPPEPIHEVPRRGTHDTPRLTRATAL